MKLRDGAQLIVDAAAEWLESMVPADVKHSEKDFDSLKWIEKTGTKAAYEQTTKEDNKGNPEVFQALQQILDDHQGFWQSANWKFWNHQNNRDLIDRRHK